MDVRKHRAKVLKDVASLPGSRDRSGGPVLLINPPTGNVSIVSKSASTSDVGGGIAFPYEDLVSLLGYLSRIPDNDALNKGFVVLIDGRKVHPKSLKNILRACQQALYKKIRLVIIVQPEKFLYQQKINFDVILEGYDFKTIMVTVHKLSKFIDISQLPEQFGGTFQYDPEVFCNERERIEHVLESLHSRRQDFVLPNYDSLPLSDNEASFRDGEQLIHDLSNRVDHADRKGAIAQIKEAIKDVQLAATQPERTAQAEREAEERNEKTLMLEEHAEGVNRLLDWLEGAGEKWLLTLHEIGETRDEAKQLLKEHQQLEIKSKEVKKQADELAELASRLMALVPAHSITLEKARDEVRSLAIQYSNRVERQMDMVKKSEQFHTLLGELSRKTDTLLESLCTDLKTNDHASTEAEKAMIEEKVSVMEKMYESVCECGASFIEDLAAVEFNFHGKRTTRDYSNGIIHIREQLQAAKERRKRCLDLVDVRRLKLQQVIQLFTCESDAQLAVGWLEELHSTLLSKYSQIGSEEEELQCLREDRMKLEETARSTYDWGKQLCQVALVLRRSLRMDVQNQITLNDKLEQRWGRLCRALSENEAKLNVTDAFNSTVIELTRRMEELEKRLTEWGNRRPLQNTQTMFQVERRRLAGDIMELGHIADMLSAQINANHNASVESRQLAMAGIRRKIDGVEDKRRRMESLFTISDQPVDDYRQNLYNSNQKYQHRSARSLNYEPPVDDSIPTKSSNSVEWKDVKVWNDSVPALGISTEEEEKDDNERKERHTEDDMYTADSLTSSVRKIGNGIGSIRLSDTESYL